MDASAPTASFLGALDPKSDSFQGTVNHERSELTDWYDIQSIKLGEASIFRFQIRIA